MSLLEDLDQAESVNSKMPGCNVCRALDEMSPEVAERVRAVIAGRTIGTEKLAAILVKNGYPAGRRAIQRHQRENHE